MQKMEKKIQKSRWYHYVIHLLSFLLGLLFIAVGGTKLAGMQMHVDNFARWQYPTWFMYVTGLVEVASALLIIFPPTRSYGATLLVFTMIGAIFTHLRAGEWFMLGNPIILLMLAVVIALSKIFRGR